MFQKIERIVFVVSFFLLLVIPLLFMNRVTGAISESENRVLASSANLFSGDGSINPSFSTDFENWFDDNLGFRDLFVKANGVIKYYLFDEINGNPLGPNGELATIYDLEDYQHKNLYSEEGLNEVVGAYNTIYDYLDSQGIQVYYMQCWDKHSIYPEQFPDTIQIYGDMSKSDQVENALLTDAKMEVIPIKEKLLQAKTKYPVYGTWSEPWHWVHRGALIAYEDLMARINENNNNKYDVIKENEFHSSMIDVGQKYFGIIHQKDMEEVFGIEEPKALSMPEKLTYRPEGGISEQTAYYENNAVDNDDTVLILGDSYFYGYTVLEAIAESFHKTIMFSGSAAQGDQLFLIIDTYKPDLVIIENAERCNYRYDEAVATANQIHMRQYVLGTELAYDNDDANLNSYIIKGIAKIDDHTWTEGNETTFFLYAPEANTGELVHGSMKIADVFDKVQEVEILINNESVFSGNVRKSDEVEFEFEMPESKMVTINLELPTAASPFSIGEGHEIRELALEIKSLRLY